MVHNSPHIIPLPLSNLSTLGHYAILSLVQHNGLLCENNISTKPEVHNVLQCYQRNKPWLQVTCIERCVKFGRVGFASGQTDRHIDKLITK